MNIHNLPPGEKLDRLIAEKVMGWKIHVEERGPHMGEIAPDGKLRLWVDGPAVKWNVLHWKPSTDIAAAWEVVTRIQELGFFWWMASSVGRPEIVMAHVRRHIDRETIGNGYATQSTAHSICRAALEALCSESAGLP